MQNALKHYDSSDVWKLQHFKKNQIGLHFYCSNDCFIESPECWQKLVAIGHNLPKLAFLLKQGEKTQKNKWIIFVKSV